MASEQRRACGYRKFSGYYLTGSLQGVSCDRLPLLAETCPCCGHGLKRARGFTWVDVNALVQGPHKLKLTDLNVADDAHEYLPNDYPCNCWGNCCTFCKHPENIGRAGLLWVSDAFYATPEEFLAEAKMLGISRRIARVPRGFKVGETWVLLGHKKAVRTEKAFEAETDGLLTNKTPFLVRSLEIEFKPGIFYVWRPEKIEKILPDDLKGSEAAAKLEKRGITPVFLTATDPDHGGVPEDLQEKLFVGEE